MSQKIIFGRYVICDEERIIPNGAVVIKQDQITDIGTYDEIHQKYPGFDEIGSNGHIVLPGFVNAHSHGVGTTAYQRGCIDNTLETWKWDVTRKSYHFPWVDPYLDCLWYSIRLIESGVTCSMHNHDLINSLDPYFEFSETIRAYQDAGIRVSFAPMLANKNIFIYGDNESFISSLPGPVQGLANQLRCGIERFDEANYFKSVWDLKREFESDRVKIIHGPLSPQWVSDDALKEIKLDAKMRGMRIHIHVLQTQLQKLYGLKKYGKSLLEHLFDLGFLGDDVTCGHCVWLNENDLDLLSATQTSVTHHPTCNLRVRNGISPVFAMLEKGIPVAIGMDDKEFSDDKDYIEEMRIASKLHRIPSHRLDSPQMTPTNVFKMGTQNGANVLGYPEVGSLAIGKQADIILINLERMMEPYIHHPYDPVDLLIYRGKAQDVDTVIVGGKILMRDRHLTQIDRSEVIRKLHESWEMHFKNIDYQEEILFQELKKHIANYYTPWYLEIEQSLIKPYYWLNNRH